ncbi:hypothetical protein [Capnocytophaga cynodegmi]|uniref:hypothetical protein n=1 Tax=Capnocytophaga cynodegmi TaxID=28189 RepID=UPI00385A21DB
MKCCICVEKVYTHAKELLVKAQERRCVALRCVALRCVALRCVALRCVALRCSHQFAMQIYRNSMSYASIL